MVCSLLPQRTIWLVRRCLPTRNPLFPQAGGESNPAIGGYAQARLTLTEVPAYRSADAQITTPVGERITITGVHTFVGTGITIGADAVIVPACDRVAVDSDPFPSYKVFNAFVEYKPQLAFDLTLRADVRNIFDELYSDRASYGQDWMSDPADPTLPLFEPGRSFLFTATSKF